MYLSRWPKNGFKTVHVEVTLGRDIHRTTLAVCLQEVVSDKVEPVSESSSGVGFRRPEAAAIH